MKNKVLLLIVAIILIPQVVYASVLNKTIKFVKQGNSVINVTSGAETVSVEYFIMPDNKTVVFYQEDRDKDYIYYNFDKLKDGGEGIATSQNNELHLFFMSTSEKDYVLIYKAKKIVPENHFVHSESGTVVMFNDNKGVTSILPYGLQKRKINWIQIPGKLEDLTFFKSSTNKDGTLIYKGKILVPSNYTIAVCAGNQDVMIYLHEDKQSYFTNTTRSWRSGAYLSFVSLDIDHTKDNIVWKRYENRAVCIFKNGEDVTENYKITNDPENHKNMIATSSDGKTYILENAAFDHSKWNVCYYEN